MHGKDVENRCPRFPRNVFGAVWLHAGKWWEADEIAFDLECAMEIAERSGLVIPVPDLRWMRDCGGHIVGSVEVVSYSSRSDSPWFVEGTAIGLRNPVPLDPPVPFRGMPDYFDVPDGLISDAV